jgi:hypothetical protein
MIKLTQRELSFMGLAKEKRLDISILPDVAQAEIIDYFQYLKYRYFQQAPVRSTNTFKALKLSTKGFKFNREEANAR